MRYILPLLLLALLSVHCRSQQVATSTSAVEATRDLPMRTVAALYTQAFSRAYPYMFSETAGGLSVSGQPYGPYRAGVKGLVLYSGLSEAVADYLAGKGTPVTTDDFYDLSRFAQLAGGIAAMRSGETEFQPWGLTRDGRQSFHFYNPDIVRWGIANLIPDPGTDIGGQPASALYERIFRPFFRLLTDTYIALETGNRAAEVAAYRQQFADPSFDGIAYLNARYNAQFPTYRPENQDFTPGMATGFWLRRDLDGTRALLWEGLSRIMQAYDAAWWAGKTGG